MYNYKFKFVGVLAFVFSVNGWALQTTFSAGGGVEHTDNAYKTDTNKVSELRQYLTANLGATHTEASVNVDANYNVTRYWYDKDTQTDRTITVGDAELIWNQIQNKLVWKLKNSVNEVVRDKTLVNIQNNRDSRSISEASGTYTVRPGQANTLSFTGNYTDISYKDTNAQDSERAGARVNFTHGLSPISNVSLGVSYEDVTRDGTLNDYEYSTATLGYGAQLSKLQYNIQLGYNQQNPEVGAQKNGFLIDARANYSYAGSVWSLVLLQELTDTSRGNNNFSVSTLSSFSNTSVTDVYERSVIDLTYSNTNICGGCTWVVGALGESERYEVFDNDNDEYAIRTSLGYAYTREINISGRIEYRDVTFRGLNPAIDYYLETYSIKVGWNFIRDLTLSTTIAFENRTSDDGLTDYEELVGGISARYQFK